MSHTAADAPAQVGHPALHDRQENNPSPTGLPLVAAQDVADLHWRLHTERNQAEAIAGDIEAIKALRHV